jgi:hypothetical protein
VCCHCNVLKSKAHARVVAFELELLVPQEALGAQAKLELLHLGFRGGRALLPLANVCLGVASNGATWAKHSLRQNTFALQYLANLRGQSSITKEGQVRPCHTPIFVKIHQSLSKKRLFALHQ